MRSKQPNRRRLGLDDGSCIRLRPTHRDHVWNHGFVMDRNSEGRTSRMLTKSGRGTPGSAWRSMSPERSEARTCSSVSATAQAGLSDDQPLT